VLKPLFDFLATKLALTKAVDFHHGLFPPNAGNNGTALTQHVPPQIDGHNPNMRWHRFQFLTRNQSYAAGDTEAQRISEIVIRLRGETLTGYYLYDVTGNGPAYVGTDEKGRHVFSANVTVSARKD